MSIICIVTGSTQLDSVMMFVFSTLLSVCLVSMVSSVLEGVSDNEDGWAYQWYTGEPFRIQCHASGLNVNDTYYAIWDTPTRKALPRYYTDDEYQVNAFNSIDDAELVVKDIQSAVHGVYTCKVYDYASMTMQFRAIYGLNIREAKYHNLIDKYTHNITVALIATAVFIVPLATVCLVWRFRYETEADRASRKSRRSGKPYHAAHEIKHTAFDEGLTDSVVSPEGKGAYENPNLSTQF